MNRIQWLFIFIIAITFLNLGIGISPAIASPLANRLAHFPDWNHKPLVPKAKEDLIYPKWMAGTWEVTSTLVDLVAPLEPKIVTPGFEENRQYLEQPIQFQVRFVPQNPGTTLVPTLVLENSPQVKIVADREFNALSIAKTYLGDAVVGVQVDPHNPNHQTTLLRGNFQLKSTITARGQENPTSDRFVTTEIAQQLFRSPVQIYLNEVETTTAYQLTDRGIITGDQVTAIYLSPQDPDYFNAAGHPVALYRYRLELIPISVISEQLSVTSDVD